MPKRKSMRLKDYDYSSSGTYFITICTQNKQHLFGSIIGQEPCSCREPYCRLSPVGEIVQCELVKLSERYHMVEIVNYVIMPNHIHFILTIKKCEEIRKPRQEPRPCPTLGYFLCAFKSITTKCANKSESVTGRKIWQFKYYDHIIRDEEDYLKILRYINENPAKWQDDCYFN